MQLHGTAAMQRSGLCATSSRPACPSLVLRPIGHTTSPSTQPRGATVLRHAAAAAATAAAASLPAPVQQQQQQQQFQQQRLLGEAAASLLASNAAFRLLATVMRACGALATKAQDALQRMHTAVKESLPQGDDLKALERQLRDSYRGAKLMAFFAPLASASADNLSAVYARTFERAAFGFAKMYLFALFMRVLLSWFPSIDWNSNPWTFLRLITEPYLQIYRGILPPLFGQLDFTPLFGFLILQDVVELMSPTYTMGMHARDTSMYWTTTDVMAYFDGH